MATIEVVENSGKRRRKLTARQRAAGFGGKRAMTRRKSTSRRPRRRNSALASYGNPGRRVTYRKRASRRVGRNHHYTRRGVVYRRRRNPKLGFLGVDLGGAAWAGGGMLAVKLGPGLVQRFGVPLPTTGIGGHLVKIGVAIGAGMLVGKFVNRQAGANVTLGGVAVVMLNLFDEYVAPNVPGLSGLLSPNRVIMAEDIETDSLSGYIPTPAGLSEYVQTPTGAYS